MYDRDLDFNYIDEKNNVEIVSFTSCHKNYPPQNILKDDLKLIWLSEKEVPQSITIDISNMTKKPEQNQFEYFGIFLWHSYQSNPKEIELRFSNNNKDFTLIGIYELDFRPGTQFFKIENNNYPNGNLINYLKITITKTYGGNRTYINQIYLLNTLSLSQYDNKYLLAFQNNFNESEDEEIEKDDKKNYDSHISINDYYQLRNKFSKNYNQEIRNKKKKFDKLLNNNKILEKIKESNLSSINKKTFNKKKGVDINTLTSHNSSSSNEEVEYSKIGKKNINNSNHLINQNFSYPSFSISNSTNQTLSKLKNTNDKKSKDFLKEELDSKLNEMNKFIRTLDTNNSTDRIKIRTPSYNSPFNFDSIKNTIFNSNDNSLLLSEKVEKIEKKINQIQNDIYDIKSSVYKLNSNRSEKSNFIDYGNYIEDNQQQIINTDNNVISEDDSSNKGNFNHNGNNYFKNKSLNKENYNYYNNYNNNNTKNYHRNYSQSYLQNFDNKLNEKLNKLSNNIEDQIYKNFIEPSINKFNKKMNKSLSQMKKQIESINSNKKKINQKKYNKKKEITSDSSSNINYENNIISSESIKYKNSRKKSSEFPSSSTSLNKENLLQMKYEKITSLSNQLYNKLCEKEKILNDKANYLKSHLENNTNTFNSTNSF